MAAAVALAAAAGAAVLVPGGAAIAGIRAAGELGDVGPLAPLPSPPVRHGRLLEWFRNLDVSSHPFINEHSAGSGVRREPYCDSHHVEAS